MKLLSISGGATKISGLVGSADSLINSIGYNPDLIVGTSAGSIIALPIALGYWEVIRKEALYFTLKDIFSIPPMKDGKITMRAKLRLLCGEISLGKQDNLYKILRRVITPLDFELYKNNDSFADVYIGVVDYKTGSRIYKNARDCEYEEYLKYVMASTSIPYAVEPVYIDDMILFDGGARDHIGSHWMMKNVEGITENVSLFSRPQNFSSILDNYWCPKNIFDIFERDQAIRVLETSKKDEELENLWADRKNIKHCAIFLPSILKSLYDTDPVRIQQLYEEGKKATLKYYKY